MGYYLFENPYPLLLALGIVELFLYLKYRTDSRPGMAKALGVVPLLGAVVVLLALFIETDREAIVRTLSDCVAAADRRDADGVLTHVDLPASPPPGNWSAREFAGGVRLGLEYVNGCRLHMPDVDVGGDSAKSDLRVTVYLSGGGVMVVTANLKWARRGERWKIVDITQIKRGAGVGTDPTVPPGQYRNF